MSIEKVRFSTDTSLPNPAQSIGVGSVMSGVDDPTVKYSDGHGFPYYRHGNGCSGDQDAPLSAVVTRLVTWIGSRQAMIDAKAPCLKHDIAALT
jgi:hypothetical protein